MAESAVGLVRTMIGRGPAHATRERERRERLRLLQKSNGLIKRGRAFLGADFSASGQHHCVAIHPAAQLLHKSGIKCRVLTRQIHLSNNGGA
jgi:hypothetical protein